MDPVKTAAIKGTGHINKCLEDDREVNRLDADRNVDIREKLRQEGVLGKVKSRQKWKIRMEEISLERTTKNTFAGEMEGKRPRGRPRLKRTDNFK